MMEQNGKIVELVSLAFLLLTIIVMCRSDTSPNSNSPKNDTRSIVDASDKPFRCYTCSWSDMANNTAANIDVCSSYKFVPKYAATVACDYGCQTVSYKATKKEDARHFHRNCLKKQSEDSELKDRCVITYSKIYGFEEICECLTNLCNAGKSSLQISQFSQYYLILPFVSLALLRTFSTFPVVPIITWSATTMPTTQLKT